MAFTRAAARTEPELGSGDGGVVVGPFDPPACTVANMVFAAAFNFFCSAGVTFLCGLEGLEWPCAAFGDFASGFFEALADSVRVLEPTVTTCADL
ncbi:MAG TPA: hypothetical protein VE983_03320 [Solirubrobacteraceae bacterium]|nr:hypothetical protein [Solirubrobacteraceae bacterium]